MLVQPLADTVDQVGLLARHRFALALEKLLSDSHVSRDARVRLGGRVQCPATLEIEQTRKDSPDTTSQTCPQPAIGSVSEGTNLELVHPKLSSTGHDRQPPMPHRRCARTFPSNPTSYLLRISASSTLTS